jgi:hypothetical protein
VFGKIQFFRDYPYVLPGMATSLIALTAAITTMFFVKEVCGCEEKLLKPLLIQLDITHAPQ